MHVVCDLCIWCTKCAGGVRSVQVGCDLCMWCATLQPSGCVKTERNIVFGAFLRNEALWLQGWRKNRTKLHKRAKYGRITRILNYLFGAVLRKTLWLPGGGVKIERTDWNTPHIDPLPYQTAVRLRLRSCCRRLLAIPCTCSTLFLATLSAAAAGPAAAAAVACLPAAAAGTAARRAVAKFPAPVLDISLYCSCCT